MTDPNAIVGEVVDQLIAESDTARVAGNTQRCERIHDQYIGVARVARAFGLSCPVAIGAHMCGNIAAARHCRQGSR